MTATVFALLVLVGVGAGLVGYLAGLASLVSYPALLAVGLPPVTANVTNTLALIGAGLGTTARSGREFLARGRRTTVVEVGIAFVGGLLGGWLLVETGESSFSSVVPWMVLVAALLILVSPRLQHMSGSHTVPRPVFLVALLLTCVYGGYFGAGSGVIYLAVAVLLSGADFTSSVLVKSILLAVSNVSAALFFIATTPIDWWAALAVGIGCVGGGYLGPVVQKMIPEGVLRVVVAVAGVFLAVWLWLHR